MDFIDDLLKLKSSSNHSLLHQNLLKYESVSRLAQLKLCRNYDLMIFIHGMAFIDGIGGYSTSSKTMDWLFLYSGIPP